jgi:protein SCO1
VDGNRRFACAAVLAGLASWTSPSWSHDGQVHGAHAPAAPAPSATVNLADVVLLDQHARRMRLADAGGDKVVAVTFVYTNCADTCPMVSHTFSQVQEKLGKLMDSRVRLLSLTIDPARDTPERLKAYSANFNAGPGWLWLTGQAGAVTSALTGFGVHIRNVENHPSLVVVGDPRTGRWTRLYDIDKPDQVVAKLNELLAARTAGTSKMGADARHARCANAAHRAVPASAKSDCVAQPAG